MVKIHTKLFLKSLKKKVTTTKSNALNWWTKLKPSSSSSSSETRIAATPTQKSDKLTETFVVDPENSEDPGNTLRRPAQVLLKETLKNLNEQLAS